MSIPPSFEKQCILGGPITSVVFRSKDELLYGQGPWLHRIQNWNGNNTSTSTGTNTTDTVNDTPLRRQPQPQKLLVFPKGGSIHGIRHLPIQQDTDDPNPDVWIFGGRQITRVSASEWDTVTTTTKKTKTSRTIHSFNDWIWDCRIIIVPPRRQPQPPPPKIPRWLCIGFAHNRIEIRNTQTMQCLLSCNDNDKHHHLVSENRISNAMNISYNHNMRDDQVPIVSIAMGTVLNDIWIWEWHIPIETTEISPPSTTTTTTSRINKHRLCGHQGVIHAIQFHATNGLLVSASDDRTVRLWTKSNSSNQNNNHNNHETTTDNNCWTLQWTGWGHTARIFDVAFCKHTTNNTNQRHPDENAVDDPAWILSTGEDSSLRVWDCPTGTLLRVFKGHACQIVWCVDSVALAGNSYSSGSVVVATGANNGTVALYDIAKHISIPFNAKKQQETESFVVPDDRRLLKIKVQKETTTTSTTMMTTNIKPKPKIHKQTLVGMQFMEELVVETGHRHPVLVVATRAGSVWKANLETKTWSECNPWRIDSDEEFFTNNEGCCMCTHPRESPVTVGTHLGDVILSSMYGSDDRLALRARQQRAVQKVQWITNSLLISFHVRAAVLWDCCSSGESVDVENILVHRNRYKSKVLRSATKGMGICSAYNKSTSLLAIGDTRGNLALFDLRTKDSDLDGMIVGPVSVVPKAHGKEHITDMIWKDDCTLLSVGNDACILESSIGEDGTLSTLLSVTVSSFSALTHIWSLTSKDNSITAAVILAGYFGNRFAVIDYNTGYEFCGVETGGRQRPLEVYQARAAIFSFPKETIMAIGHTVENGRNELILHNFGVHGIPAARHMSFPRHSWGFPLHGESIFDITFVQLGKMQSTFALISGSEDCSSIVSLIHKGVALSRKMLPPDVSGIRAVCSNQLISGETFLAIGGKLTLQFFVVELVDTNNDLECKIRHLGKGAPPKKPTIDHRLNSIVAFPIKEDDGVMVASGDSDGCCYLYIVSASCTGRLLHRTDYPILCLYSIKFAELRLLLMGTTSGEVMVFIAPQTSNDLDSLVATTDPIMRYKAHSMGTNAICAIQHRSPGNIDNFLRICTAGDDQAICCGDIQINYGEAFVTAQASVLRLLWAKDASMSAFKGIEMIDEDRFVVSGHDQRLSLWQVEDDAKMNHLLSEPVDIGDINSFSMCKSHDGQYFIGVAGAGVELFTLKV